MEITASELYKASNVLDRIFSTPMDDAKLIYSMIKIQKQISAEIEPIIETRVILLNKYAKKNIKGEVLIINDIFQFDPAEGKKFNKEWKEFGEKIIKLDAWKIPFEAIEKVSLSINDMVLIEKFVAEPVTIEE